MTSGDLWKKAKPTTTITGYPGAGKATFLPIAWKAWFAPSKCRQIMQSVGRRLALEEGEIREPDSKKSSALVFIERNLQKRRGNNFSLVVWSEPGAT